MRRSSWIGIGALALQLAVGGFALVGSSADAAAPSCAGVRATIVLEESQNGTEVFGTEGRDVIVGTAGPDIVDGLGGDDLMCLGGGDDKVRFSQLEDGDDKIYAGSGNDTLVGAGGDDKLFGGRGNDQFLGGPGSDTCKGGRGTDGEAQGPDSLKCEVVTGIP